MNTSFKTGNKAYEKVLNLGSNQKSEYWNHDMNQNVKNFLSWAISTLVRCESVITLIYCWLECKLGEGNGTPLQYPCLENPMGRGAWWAAVHGVTKSQTWLSDFTFTFHFHALEKEMATHSSVLAWRVPGTGEPGGLPSMGSHRVGHDWSDLAAAVAAAECKLVQSLGEKCLTLPPKVEDSWTLWANLSTPRAECIREMHVQVHHGACISISTIMETENTHCLPMVEWFIGMYS